MILSLKEYFQSMKHDAPHQEQFQQEFLYALGNYPTHNWEEEATFMNQE
jgi:hypothetical protein